MIHSHTHLRKGGFALIISLSLMAFILLLLLSIVSFTSVEVTNASRNANRKEAEENARLAAMVALGELQKALGPDQRISAPGGQRLSAGDTSPRQHWVGVYDAWDDSSNTRPTPSFHQWLISGDRSIVTNITSAETTTPLSGALVTLLPAEFDYSASVVNEAIEAGLRPIDNTGAYAWWVGEENTKAKIGNTVPDALSVIEATNRLQSAPRAAHEFLLGTALPASSPLFDKLTSEQQLALSHFGLNPEKTPYRHDYSLTARGLLTDVRSGGFRKDLSLYLQQPLDDFTTTLASQYEPLYSVGAKGGFQFFELWRDFNVWGEIQYPDSPPPHEDGGTIASGTPFFVAEPTPAAAQADPFVAYKHITKLKTTLLFSLMAEEVDNPDGTPDPYYDLYVVVDPIFTVWNPNNIAIQIPSSTLTTFKTWMAPYDLEIRFDQGSSLPTYKQPLFELFVQNFLNAEVGKNQDFVIRPGEVQIQSQGYGAPMQELTTSSNVRFATSIGYSFASGFRKIIDYAPITDRDGTQEITFSFSPSDRLDTGKGYGLFLSGHSFGQPDSGGTNYHLGNHSINVDVTGNNDLRASDFPDVFPSISEDLSRTIKIHEPDPLTAGLTKVGKWPLAAFSLGVKTEVDPLFSGLPPSEQGTRMTGRSMLRFNPSSFYVDMFKLQPNMLRASPLQVGMRRIDSFLNSGIELDANGLSYYGASYEAADGTSYVISRSVAESPIHLIGAMQHFIPDGKPRGQTAAGRFRYAYDYLQPSIQQAIGNSFAPSIMDPDESSAIVDGILFADHSYLANESLWDDYFFSSLDPVTEPAYKNPAVAYSEQRSRFQRFIGVGGLPYDPLPNDRHLPWTNDPAVTFSELFSSGGSRADAYLKMASHLMVDGMFNVNSTSVSAWKAVFAGLKDATIPVRPADASSGSLTLTSGSNPSSNTVVPGLLVAGDGEIPPGTLGDPKEPEQWLGFRTLTDAQLDELARAVVEQVRLRSPFLSLADFVNRRLSNDPALAQSGSLQSALDDPSVTINQAYRSGDRSLSLAEAQADGFPFPQAEAAVKSVAAPGYVDQADILTSIGPLLSARGDTFTIRSYGEATDPVTGATTTSVYCEMVVQRTPNYVDASDANEEDASNLSPVNQTFGRKFHIISFRFIDPDEAS